MAQPAKLALCAVVMLFTVLACGQAQPPQAALPPSGTATTQPTLEPTQTQAATDTQVQPPAPTETATMPPVQPPTQPVVEKGVFQRVTALPGPLPDAYSEIQVVASGDGAAWVISSQEALRWHDQAWEAPLSESGDLLASVDDSGRLWVLRPEASEISAWQDGQWTAYGAESGWTEAPTFADMRWWSPSTWRAYSDAAGMVWLPMSRDVRIFNGKQWNIHTLEDMSFPPPENEDLGIIHLLAMEGGGADAWVGECYYAGPGPIGGQGVRWLDGKTWKGADAPAGPTCVPAITTDPAGNVWLGAYGSVWRYGYADQSWTEYSLPRTFLDDYRFAYPRQLIADQNGDAWVMYQLCGGASCSGPVQLYRIHNEEWTLIKEAANWDLPLKHLTLDGSGQGWLFWDGEVYRLDGESIEPVASLLVRSVDVSPDGKVWMVAEEEEGAALWRLEP